MYQFSKDPSLIGCSSSLKGTVQAEYLTLQCPNAYMNSSNSYVKLTVMPFSLFLCVAQTDKEHLEAVLFLLNFVTCSKTQRLKICVVCVGH